MLLTTTLATCVLLATPETFNFDFEGGPMSAWAASVIESAPGTNMVMTEDAARINLPPMHLKDVSVSTLMSVFDALTPHTSCLEVEQDGGQVWVMNSTPVDQRRILRHADEVKLGTSVCSIPDAFRVADGPERLIEAVRTVCALDGTDTLSVCVVPGTHLLAIHGSGTQLALAEQIVEEIEHDSMTRPQGRTRAGNPRGSARVEDAEAARWRGTSARHVAARQTEHAAAAAGPECSDAGSSSSPL
ncbi:MAG: hypothetical protein QF733_08160 [Phycisphaerales bacterium]|nr:hypothetical protein [Phycisphaerales bacterium]